METNSRLYYKNRYDGRIVIFDLKPQEIQKGSSPVSRKGDPVSRTGGAFLIARYKDENPFIRQDSRAKKQTFFNFWRFPG